MSDSGRHFQPAGIDLFLNALLGHVLAVAAKVTSTSELWVSSRVLLEPFAGC